MISIPTTGLRTKVGSLMHTAICGWELCRTLWHKVCQLQQDECWHKSAIPLCDFGGGCFQECSWIEPTSWKDGYSESLTKVKTTNYLLDLNYASYQINEASAGHALWSSSWQPSEGPGLWSSRMEVFWCSIQPFAMFWQAFKWLGVLPVSKSQFFMLTLFLTSTKIHWICSMMTHQKNSNPGMID